MTSCLDFLSHEGHSFSPTLKCAECRLLNVATSYISLNIEYNQGNRILLLITVNNDWLQLKQLQADSLNE